ncbi:MAG: hypothetical protein MR910_09690 [Clostridiales bacterium]|nr:hypothetical protein [Clostridiales bacterium]
MTFFPKEDSGGWRYFAPAAVFMLFLVLGVLLLGLDLLLAEELLKDPAQGQAEAFVHTRPSLPVRSSSPA